MTTTTLLICTLLTGPTPGPTLRLSHCVVAPQEEALVPARAAGVLKSIRVREGQRVQTDAILAQIDDALPRGQWAVAHRQWDAARAAAENDISIRLAVASAAVAAAEVDAAAIANNSVAGTIPDSEVRRLRLSNQHARLQIEQSQLDYKLLQKSANMRASEVAVAKLDVASRQVRSPLEGIVVELFRHRGEWVQPGEPICHVVRLDVLRVEGFLSASQVRPQSLVGRRVSVEVSLSTGKTESFTGELEFVSPMVDANGDCRVWARLENRQSEGKWILQPGSTVSMDIQLPE